MTLWVFFFVKYIKNVNLIIKGKRNNFLKNVKISLWELLLQEFLSSPLQRPTIIFIIIETFDTSPNFIFATSKAERNC